MQPFLANGSTSFSRVCDAAAFLPNCFQIPGIAIFLLFTLKHNTKGCCSISPKLFSDSWHRNLPFFTFSCTAPEYLINGEDFYVIRFLLLLLRVCFWFYIYSVFYFTFTFLHFTFSFSFTLFWFLHFAFDLIFTLIFIFTLICSFSFTMIVNPIKNYWTLRIIFIQHRKLNIWKAAKTRFKFVISLKGELAKCI